MLAYAVVLRASSLQEERDISAQRCGNMLDARIQHAFLPQDSSAQQSRCGIGRATAQTRLRRNVLLKMHAHGFRFAKLATKRFGKLHNSLRHNVVLRVHI